jgi:hypothetical protein
LFKLEWDIAVNLSTDANEHNCAVSENITESISAAAFGGYKQMIAILFYLITIALVIEIGS